MPLPCLSRCHKSTGAEGLRGPSLDALGESYIKIKSCPCHKPSCRTSVSFPSVYKANPCLAKFTEHFSRMFFPPSTAWSGFQVSSVGPALRILTGNSLGFFSGMGLCFFFPLSFLNEEQQSLSTESFCTQTAPCRAGLFFIKLCAAGAVFLG